MLFFVGVCLQRAGHFFVSLLQPACLFVFTRVFKFLSPLSLPISPPGRVTCEEVNYGIFLKLIWWALQNCPGLPSVLHLTQDSSICCDWRLFGLGVVTQSDLVDFTQVQSFPNNVIVSTVADPWNAHVIDAGISGLIEWNKPRPTIRKYAFSEMVIAPIFLPARCYVHRFNIVACTVCEREICVTRYCSVGYEECYRNSGKYGF